MRKLLVLIFLVLATNLIAKKLMAQTSTPHPRVLVVMAHPDDESVISVALYKIAKEQHGTVDLFVITDGEAGFKYSSLAEQYYNLKLADERDGKANLPRIRKRELMNAGKILGISRYYFLSQPDAHFGLNEREPLDTSWNVRIIKKQLRQLLLKNSYDYVFCLLPSQDTHGEHKAATLLALNVIGMLPASRRPVVLGALTQNKTDTLFRFSQYKDYAETKVIADTPLFKLDRTTSFSYKNRLNYKVIANWEIAEHKSQGYTQMTMNDGDLEEFWYFSINGDPGFDKCSNLFNLLSQPPIPYQANQR
ncbi:MAG: PIG-L family deacetylase [Mucilaginibacter sp.]